MDVIPTPTEDEPLGLSEPEARTIRAWRAEQLSRLGLPYIIAETVADLVDWHAFAELIDRGCSPGLALEILR